MIFLRNDLYLEPFDGALLRKFFDSKYFAYSGSWARKNLSASGCENFDFKKVKLKQAVHLSKLFPTYSSAIQPSLSTIAASSDLAQLPDFNVDMYEESGEAAPIFFYFLRDISDPLSIHHYDEILANPQKILENFPYGDFLAMKEHMMRNVGAGAETTLDGCISILTSLYIDLAPKLSINEFIEELVLTDVLKKYSKNYAVPRYVSYRLDQIKKGRVITLSDLYKHWGSWENEGDPEACEKRLKRWRSGDNIPNLTLFADFMHLIGGRSKRTFFDELEWLALFVSIQLIQKYLGAFDVQSDSKLMSENFYRERIHFWHAKLTEQYSDVLERRATEIESEAGGPS